MAVPAKQSSRWGSFLQQAVAGVESRLDDILAEGGDSGIKEKPASSSIAAAPVKADAVPRSASKSSKVNDRLHDRLTKALANKNVAPRTASPTNPRSRTRSPHAPSGSPRQSLEDTGAASSGRPSLSRDRTNGDDAVPGPSSPGCTGESGDTRQSDVDASPRVSIESTKSNFPQDSIEASSDLSSQLAISKPVAIKDPAFGPVLEYDALISQLKSDLEQSELQKQEEIHAYVERIDGLQSKLQYLTKESKDAAKKARGLSPSESMERRVAEKDEQIALLMEEGQQLSKKELSHLTLIKKLRTKVDEKSKDLAQTLSKQGKAERDNAIITDRSKKAEDAQKRLTEKCKSFNQLQKEAERLKVERDAHEAKVVELKIQLEAALATDKLTEIMLTSEALEREKKQVAELEDEVSNLKIEKQLVSDRAQTQIKELNDKMDRAAEQFRMANLEMKSEQQMLESRLEIMRARAEEVSSGATGDAQAKFLRQIETLQTQYSVASENWQGIEASLVARVAALEMERDDLVRKETDLRRKAREAITKAKHIEEALEEKNLKSPSFEQEFAEHKYRLEKLQHRAEAAETALIDARSTFDKEKQAWALEMQHRIEEERMKWLEENSGRNSLVQSRAESPALTTRRGLTSELLGLQNIQTRRPTSRSSNSEATFIGERFMNRRQSNQPTLTSGQGSPPRQDSTTSILPIVQLPETSSIHTVDHDEFFENHRSASPPQTINEMASASMTAAGPSVQLVERMSSAVRRLESEKVTSKEVISRLSAQRDEARGEIVSLMKEVEVKRAADRKVSELEEEMKIMNARYQTTLEMLGEKSELVNELRSDIDDIKAMYRELVERTVT